MGLVTTVKPSLFISLLRMGIEGRTWEECGMAEDLYDGGGK